MILVLPGFVVFLLICRAWCRGIAQKIAVGAYSDRSALTRRIMRAMSWRVALVWFIGTIVISLVAIGDPASAGATFGAGIGAGIFLYPLTLLSLWQVARRISHLAFEANDSQQKRPTLSAGVCESAIKATRFRPTIVEGVVAAIFVLNIGSLFLGVVLPIFNKRLSSRSNAAT